MPWPLPEGLSGLGASKNILMQSCCAGEAEDFDLGAGLGGNVLRLGQLITGQQHTFSLPWIQEGGCAAGVPNRSFCIACFRCSAYNYNGGVLS